MYELCNYLASSSAFEASCAGLSVREVAGLNRKPNQDIQTNTANLGKYTLVSLQIAKHKSILHLKLSNI